MEGMEFSPAEFSSIQQHLLLGVCFKSILNLKHKKKWKHLKRGVIPEISSWSSFTYFH